MTHAKRFLSPLSSSGSFLFSVLAHMAVVTTVILAMRSHLEKPVKQDEYLDLGYQTFDEPPPPAPEEKRVARSREPAAPVDAQVKPEAAPKEIQDEKGEVAGTQKAAPAESSIGSQNDGTATATPYYKIKPKYPKAALQAGTEGWVLMKIDINEQGQVENIRVVDGEQRNMFQNEARRAVSEWKYRPFVDGGGKPFRKTDHQVRVDFKLEETRTE